MATSIVDTLFGVSPERLQQQRAAAADAQALEFAKLDPFQQANFAIGRGAFGLAGALGGALGGQDPELQRVTMRQQIARQINPSDPETIRQGIAAMQQAGDTEGAMLLQTEFQKMQLGQAQIASEQALTAQRLRDKEGVDPLQQLLRTGNFTPTSLAKYKTSQNIADLELVDKTSPLAPLAQERLAALVASRTGKPPGSVEYQAAFNASLDKQMAKSPGVVVQTGDKRDENIFAAIDVKRLKDFTDASAAARKLKGDSQTIARLLKGAGGGQFIKLTTEIQRNLGFETDRVTANDLVTALATRGAVGIRAEGSGSTSDMEFNSYLQAFPSLANSEAGRELMSKYAAAFSTRSAKLADKVRELILARKFSEQAINEYDDSLGPVLDDEFYNFSPGRRPNVPVYTPPAATPAAPTGSQRSVNDVVNQYLAPN